MTPIAIGVGCRRGCAAAEIVALVRATLADLPAAAGPAGLFTHEAKRDEPGLAEAAAILGLRLSFLDAATLRGTGDAALTHSPRVEAMFGLPGIAETAALAGAGAGARLIVSRRASAAATCAIAGPAGAGGDAAGV